VSDLAVKIRALATAEAAQSEITRYKGLYDDATQRQYAAEYLSTRLTTAGANAYGARAVQLTQQADAAREQASAAQAEALDYLQRAELALDELRRAEADFA
jgi:hypothetical protein